MKPAPVPAPAPVAKPVEVPAKPAEPVAAKPEPKPPVPQPAVEHELEAGMLDTLTGNPLYLGGAAGLLALLGAAR